jgi:hypothetical protein
MSNKHYISIRPLMRRKPSAEIIPRNINSAIRLIPRIDLGVDYMRLSEHVGEKSVDMSWERTKGLVIAEKAMDVDDEELPSLVLMMALS